MLIPVLQRCKYIKQNNPLTHIIFSLRVQFCILSKASFSIVLKMTGVDNEQSSNSNVKRKNRNQEHSKQRPKVKPKGVRNLDC